MTIREKAKAYGHEPVGKLKRLPDYEFELNGENVRLKEYADEEGTVYSVDFSGRMVCVCGDDWCL